ncbi:MAG: trypsin-like peptidase domain-containing protein, partial [Phycisphaerales bacterium]|nr:trypsin-like peptidase domain-containing protein [Phycisphaerales bacterium]
GEDGSYLMIHSVEDGHWQRLDAEHVQNWNMTSAVFNGDTVYIELWAFADTGENRVVITEVEAGDPAQAESICDGADDRVLSYDLRVALMSNGCTAWLINHGNSANRFLTAGHCISPSNRTAIMHFNVPLSTSGGAFRAPAPEYQYPIQAGSIQSINTGLGNDMALFQTNVNSNTGLTPRDAQGDAFNLANPPVSVSNQTVRVTGHGLRDPNHPQIPPEWSTAQKTHTGPLVGRNATRLAYRADTTGGNSGSPVILESTGNAIGIHTHGGCIGNSGGNRGTVRDHPLLVNMLANPLGTNIEQNPLGASSTLFASDNNGSDGGAVYFDVEIAGVPLHVRGLELNIGSSQSAEFDVSVYITTDTSVGKETNASAWTLVGEGWALAQGTDNPTRVILSESFTLNAYTSYGIAVVADGAAHRYTNGDGSNEVYTSAEMTITGGGATNTPFSGSVFSPRVFNGSLIYQAESGAVVSNMFGDDATSTSIGGDNIKAMGFTMPPALVDHRLDRVVLRIENATAGATARARIYADDNGGPGTLVTTLVSSSLTSERRNYSFTPSTSVTLASGETYWLVVHNTGSGDFSWMADSAGIIPTGAGQHVGALFSTTAPTPPSSSDTSTVLSTYAVFATPVAPAGTLVTADANNGSGGVFMNLRALNQNLTVNGIGVAYSGTNGSAVQVEVWTRSGSYAGNTDSSSGWTLSQTVSGTRMGANTFSPLVLTNPIELVAGQSRAVYLHCITPGGGIRFTGTAANPPQTTWNDGELELFSDAARTGDVSFGGSLSTPRTFAGYINYVPAGVGPTCPPDLNGDGVVDADDFFLFLQLFTDGDPRADFNNDGVIDADDFFAFLAAFAAGC